MSFYDGRGSVPSLNDNCSSSQIGIDRSAGKRSHLLGSQFYLGFTKGRVSVEPVEEEGDVRSEVHLNASVAQVSQLSKHAAVWEFFTGPLQKIVRVLKWLS